MTILNLVYIHTSKITTTISKCIYLYRPCFPVVLSGLLFHYKTSGTPWIPHGEFNFNQDGNIPEQLRLKNNFLFHVRISRCSRGIQFLLLLELSEKWIYKVGFSSKSKFKNWLTCLRFCERCLKRNSERQRNVPRFITHMPLFRIIKPFVCAIPS